MSVTIDQRKKLKEALGDSEKFYARRLHRVLDDESSSRVDVIKATYDFLNERYLTVRQSWRVESSFFQSIPEPFQDLIDYNPYSFCLELKKSISDEDVWLIGNRKTDLQVESGGRIDELLSKKLDNQTYTHYQSPGQRKACQAVLLMEEGSTMIVNLPTGGGKTLVIQCLAKFNESRGTLLCVVPTNALKLEQAQRYFEGFCKPNPIYQQKHLFWSPDSQSTEDKNEILTLIESGRLPILFCSPEAITGRLLESLKLAAESRYLHSIAVDEAHLIAQWGADFRPHFETLPLIIDSLLKLSNGNIKLILLSATWSNRVYIRVKELFERISKIEYVSSVFLRAEPRYEVESCAGNKEKRLLNELSKRPFPMIIYCITKIDSERVFQLLKNEGWARVGLFNGDVTHAERERLLFHWKQNYIDIMVATSAFGVGMDKPDVRSIIHYGMPETLDRYYQDCGRAGRDGYASSCLMLYESKDIKVAKRMARIKILTGKVARNRFNGLLSNALKKRDDSYIIAPETIPPHLVYQGNSNQLWNWKTLLLLQRMGVINLQLLSRDEFESVKKEDDHPYVGLKYIRIDVLDYNLYGPDFWDFDFESIKSQFTKLNISERSYLDRLLEPKIELCKVFGEYFKFAEAYPEEICRGCTGHVEKRLHKVGKFPVSTVHFMDPLTLYVSEPVGFEMEEDLIFTEKKKSLLRLLDRLCRKKQVKFIRCSQVVKYEILSSLPTNWTHFVVFKDIGDPEFSSDEFTIFYEKDASVIKFRDDIVMSSRFLLTDLNLKHWSGSGSVLERLQNVFVIENLEGTHFGTL